MTDFIPVARPDLDGNEMRYVQDALRSSWISSSGPYLDTLESRFADVCGVEHAIACANGTVALHLVLAALGVGPGDEVVVPTLTYVASANAIAYTGAVPVLVDSDAASWNLSVADVAASITPRTRAIMAVHLYGNPADMAGLRSLGERAGVAVIEDGAEGLGASVAGEMVGSLGAISAFSFYGNKVITTGEGGMVTTDDADLARMARQLRGQGQDPERRYWFPVLGFNYRLTNLQAAVGVAQLERLPDFLAARDRIAAWYRDGLKHLETVRHQVVAPAARAVNWLYSVTIAGAQAAQRDAVMAAMREDGVDSRPFFYPMHQMPVYAPLDRPSGFPVADGLAAGGISLPTWVGMTEEHVDRVCAALSAAISRVLPG